MPGAKQPDASGGRSSRSINKFTQAFRNVLDMSQPQNSKASRAGPRSNHKQHGARDRTRFLPDHADRSSSRSHAAGPSLGHSQHTPSFGHSQHNPSSHPVRFQEAPRTRMGYEHPKRASGSLPSRSTMSAASYVSDWSSSTTDACGSALTTPLLGSTSPSHVSSSVTDYDSRSFASRGELPRRKQVLDPERNGAHPLGTHPLDYPKTYESDSDATVIVHESDSELHLENDEYIEYESTGHDTDTGRTPQQQTSGDGLPYTLPPLRLSPRSDEGEPKRCVRFKLTPEIREFNEDGDLLPNATKDDGKASRSHNEPPLILDVQQMQNGVSPGLSMLRHQVRIQERLLAARENGDSHCVISGAECETFGDSSTKHLLVNALRDYGYQVRWRSDDCSFGLHISWCRESLTG